MNILKPAFLLLISALTQNALYSMNPAQRPLTGKGLELCISGLLSNPGDDTDDTKKVEALFNIIQKHGLDVALMNDYARIDACTHYIKRAFGDQNIAQIIQQPGLTQCITDALRYTYEFLDDDTIRHHAHNITRQLRQTTTMHTKRSRSQEENPCSESEESMTKKQCTQPEEVATTTHANTSVVPLWEHPHLINHIATFLPLQDRFHLACTSKATSSSLKEPNTLEHLRTFMREIANPIDYILHKAHGNPNVSIDGIIYNTQEVLAFLYANIAEVLINNVYDPIIYVLEKAQGSPTVEIYGQRFSTNALIKELYKLGADVNRVHNRTLTHCIDFGNYNPGGDIGFPDHLEKIEIAQDIYASLDSEQQLDLAQWHIIEYNAPILPWEHAEISEHIQEINESYQGLIQQCQDIAQKYPKDGIILYMPLSEEDVVMTKELIDSLSKFNIVSLILENTVDFCDGIHHLAQLKHLRELYIFEIYDDKFNVFPQELCNLTQLRSLVIHAKVGDAVEVTIPSDIKNLKKLRFLDLRELDLDQFPSEIGELKQLQLLAFDYVGTLTPELASLKNIQVYQGTWEQTDTNKILAQQCLSRLKKLHTIYIVDDYQLEDLGKEMEHLISLKSIHIDHEAHGGFEGIRYIPDNIELLPSLQELIIAAYSSDYTISFTLLKHIVNKRITIWFNEFDNLEALIKIIALREYIMNRKSLSEYIVQSNGDLSMRTEITQMAALLLEESVSIAQLKHLVAKYNDIKSYVDFFDAIFV